MKLTTMNHRGPWENPVNGKAFCPDGIIRSFIITGHPDTFFSIPARITYKGKSVTGFVTSSHCLDGRIVNIVDVDNSRCGDITDEYEFVPNKYGKNGDIFWENN